MSNIKYSRNKSFRSYYTIHVDGVLFGYISKLYGMWELKICVGKSDFDISWHDTMGECKEAVLRIAENT